MEELFSNQPQINLPKFFPHIEELGDHLVELDKATEDRGENFQLRCSLNQLTIHTDEDAIAMLRSFMQVIEKEYAPQYVLGCGAQICALTLSSSKDKFERLMAERKITSEFLWKIFKPGMRVRAAHRVSDEMGTS